MSEFEFSRFGDYLDNQDGDRPDELAKEWAEIQDPEISDLLLYMESSEVDLEGNAVYEMLKKKGYNRTVKHALDNGKEEYLRVMRGSDQMGRDLSGYRAIMNLEREWIENADKGGVTKIIYSGEEGTGKTNGAAFEATEVAPRVLQAYKNKKVAVAGNVKIGNVDELPVDVVEYCNSTSEMDEILEEYYEKDGWELIFILDEGDQILGGFGSSNITGRDISDRVKLFRKHNAHIIITSQTQVTADLRRNFGDIRKKPDKHNEGHIIVASDIDSNGEIDPDNIKWEAQGFPETNAQYDTAAKGTWTHDDGEEDDESEEVKKAQEKAAEEQARLDKVLYQLKEVAGLSYGDIVDKTGVPKSTAHKAVKRHGERLENDRGDGMEGI